VNQNALDTSDSRTAVVLVNFNTADHSLSCVESLAKGLPSPLIVVVDNASATSDYQKLLACPVPIVVIRSNENVGFGRGNNIGIDWVLANSKCRYIFILNNDTLVQEDALERLETFMDANPDVGACSPRIMMAAEKERYWYGGGNLNWFRGGARSWRFMQQFDDDLAVCDVTFMTGCAMFLRREMVEELGGFDPRFFMYCEDWELSARIAKSNWGARYYPSAVLYHVGHASIRGRQAGYSSPLDPGSLSLEFYLSNVVMGSLLALRLSATSAQQIGGVLYFFGRWSKWSLRFLRYRQWKAFRAIWHGLNRYREIRQQPQAAVVPKTDVTLV